jgi:hypothetical protein
MVSAEANQAIATIYDFGESVWFMEWGEDPLSILVGRVSQVVIQIISSTVPYLQKETAFSAVVVMHLDETWIVDFGEP